MSKSCYVVVFVAALCLVLSAPVTSQGQILLSEDFEGLTLQAFPTESGGDGTDWTDTPPSGWSVDNSQMGAEGRQEWQGWNFADKNSWANAAGNQRRVEFLGADNVAAIADADEWDDVNDPASKGTFNSFLVSPSVSLSGVADNYGSVVFNSAWRPEGNMTATLTVSFDGGSETEILKFASPDTDPNYHDHNLNELVIVPFEVPGGAQNAVFKWGLTNAGNNWFWAIDNIKVVEGLSPAASRLIENPVFAAGDAVAVELTVTMKEGFTDPSAVIEETLPTGFTAENISDGGSFADGKVTWNLTDFSGSKTLTYDAVATDAADAEPVLTGTVDGSLNIMGSSKLSKVEPLGIFENHIDIGNIQAKGDATYDEGSGDYTVIGGGADIWGTADGMHYAYTEVTGGFSIVARNIFIDIFDGDEEWVKGGPMIRDNLSAGSPNAFAMLKGQDQSYRPQWRSMQDGGSSGGEYVDFLAHSGNLMLERNGTTLSFYYFDESDNPILVQSQVIENMDDPVYAGLAVTSHKTGALSQGYFSNVEITEYPFEILREMPGQFPWKGSVNNIRVLVNVRDGESPNIDVTEMAPEGWVVSNVHTTMGDASVSGNEISWSLSGATGTQVLSYDASATGDEVSAEWSGNASGGGVDVRVAGPFRAAAAPPTNSETLLFEDFEGLPLEPYQWENYSGDVWTKTPPEGWSVDDSGVPAEGVPEWRGWSFTNYVAWATVAGDQRRSEYNLADDTIAVVDPDEWDDTGHDAGTYNSYMSTPSISLAGYDADTVLVIFDSSWRPEDDQKVSLTVQFDGGEKIDILRWVSRVEDADPNAGTNGSIFKDDNSTNERLFFPVPVPSGAQEMVLEFGMYDAGNDWWWAIDDVTIAVETPVQPLELPVSENFDGLTLGPNTDEDTASDNAWTDDAPQGWTINDFGVPGAAQGIGVDEWAGWSFANYDWWVNAAGDQDRSQFANASGNVAVVDPDEWDDQDSVGDLGFYNSYLSTPPISLSGAQANSLEVSFDSSWRPEDHQKANVFVSYDGGENIELMRWNSYSGTDNYKPDATNERVVLDLNNPAGASSMVVTWGMLDAGNDWWWAIDNIFIGEKGTPVNDWSLY